MKNAIIIILALAILTLTNPSKSQYTAWAKEEIVEKSSNSIMTYLGGPIIGLTTVSKDFLVGTVYTTFYDGKEIKTLGMLGNFISFRDLKKEVFW